MKMMSGVTVTKMRGVTVGGENKGSYCINSSLNSNKTFRNSLFSVFHYQ